MVVTVSHHFFFDKQDVHDENDDHDDDNDNDNGDDDNDTDVDDDDNAVLTSLPKTFTSVCSMFISLPSNLQHATTNSLHNSVALESNDCSK